jgi:RNA polymerase-binding transcription factor DksA
VTVAETRKVCTGECRRLLPPSAFGLRRPKCRDCEATIARQRRAADPDFQARQREREAKAELLARGLKRCANADCRKVLSLDAFSVSSATADGRYSYCRKCCAQIDMARHPKSPPAPLVMTYQAVHSRMKRERPPVESFACVGCGKRAKEWAYDHGDPDERISNRGPYTYSFDPARYQPMCRTCHRKFDAAHHASDRAKRLAARACKPGKPCVICGTEFWKENSRTKTCSPPCQSALRSQRQIERQDRVRQERVLSGRMARELAVIARIGGAR